MGKLVIDNRFKSKLEAIFSTHSNKSSNGPTSPYVLTNKDSDICLDFSPLGAPIAPPIAPPPPPLIQNTSNNNNNNKNSMDFSAMQTMLELLKNNNSSSNSGFNSQDSSMNQLLTYLINEHIKTHNLLKDNSINTMENKQQLLLPPSSNTNILSSINNISNNQSNNNSLSPVFTYTGSGTNSVSNSIANPSQQYVHPAYQNTQHIDQNSQDYLQLGMGYNPNHPPVIINHVHNHLHVYTDKAINYKSLHEFDEIKNITNKIMNQPAYHHLKTGFRMR